MADQGRKRGKFFYGWWIVIGGLLIMATCYTVFVNCIPLFQTHIVRDLGLTVGQFNTGVSITTVVAVFASLVIGKLTDKCSARVLGAVTVLTSWWGSRSSRRRGSSTRCAWWRGWWWWPARAFWCRWSSPTGSP